MGSLTRPDAIALKVRFSDIDDPDQPGLTARAVGEVVRDRARKLEAVAFRELKDLFSHCQIDETR